MGAARSGDASGVVSLPVLGTASGSSGSGRRRRSGMGRWRAAVLIGVHVLFAVHIAHWLIAGETISPVEPSESMYTLEQGELNAGFIFFTLALLSTVIFGRFFCGWGCHVVALQDMCGWMLKKINIRPKVFRSRLLMLVPLGLALYMFVWPTFRRDALSPLLRWIWPEGLVWIGAVQPFPGFSNHLTKEDFWETFADPVVAVPFLLVVGFASVYFLGAKAFCTYGCPYGGFFAPLDKVAPGRIVVDHDACGGSGHCTATCTSNVRVHEEIRDHGMVVDPGCMKCMDCVSVCPNNALAFKIVRPPLFGGRRPRAGAERAPAPPSRWDLSWGEEFTLAGVFLFSFFALRGLYGVVPMLFAVGLGLVCVAGAWKVIQMLRRPSVRMTGAQLKLRGRIMPGGWGFLGAAGLSTVFLLHAGTLAATRHVGEWIDARVKAPRAAVMHADRSELDDEDVARAERALGFLTLAGGFEEGGLGLAATPGLDVRRAWLSLVVGDYERAERELRSALQREGRHDALVRDLAQVQRLQGDIAGAIETCRSALEREANLPLTRERLAGLLLETGARGQAEDLFESRLAERPDEAASRAAYAELLLSIGQAERAMAQAAAGAEALDPSDRASGARSRLASLLLRLGAPERAIGLYADAVETRPRDARLRSAYAMTLLRGGRALQALNEARRAVERRPRDPSIRNTLGAALAANGRAEEALEQIERAASLDPLSSAAYLSHGASVSARAGLQTRAAEYERRSRQAQERFGG